MQNFKTDQDFGFGIERISSCFFFPETKKKKGKGMLLEEFIIWSGGFLGVIALVAIIMGIPIWVVYELLKWIERKARGRDP